MFELYCDVCIDYEVSLDPDVSIWLYLGLQVNSAVGITYADIQEVANVDEKFLSTGGITSNSGCDAIYFYACQDSDCSVTWSDSRIVLSAADSIIPA
jgi:hypothetical protein